MTQNVVIRITLKEIFEDLFLPEIGNYDINTAVIIICAFMDRHVQKLFMKECDSC